MSENDIVISGMSGRFPLSGNTNELAHNVFSGKDLITQTNDRWPESEFTFYYVKLIIFKILIKVYSESILVWEKSKI